ncbi:hypothetical protein [Phytobacter sp. V91]|uniref:hypothetical protein n=1 Tax=Phytobacter sp. V91 TaxID=3369425 RepID=UPI003F63772B
MKDNDLNSTYQWEVMDDGLIPQLEYPEPLEVVYRGNEGIININSDNVEWDKVIKWRLVCL